MKLTVGSTGYIITKGYLEECLIQAVHDGFYTVKSSYYTFDVLEKKMYATKEQAETALQALRDKRLDDYLEDMNTKESFITFCIQKTHHEAQNPEDYDRELILAIEQRYREFFGKDLEV